MIRLSLIAKQKMASSRTVEDRTVIEKLAVITFDEPVNEMEFRRYFKRNWQTLTKGLKDGSTILFIAGVHGEDTGKLGPAESIETLKNQVRICKRFTRFSIIDFIYLSSSLKFLMLIGF